MIRITIESDEKEGTIEMVTKWCRAAPNGSDTTPLPPEEAVASFTVNPPNEGYIISFTDTSTSGGNPITAWAWRIEGPGGTVATSTEQNPTFDLAAEGPNDYDVFLSVFAGGEWSPEATDSFTLVAPATDDDVAWGYPTTTSSNFTDERIAVPIVRARDGLGAELVSPAQVELTIKEDDVAVYGPTVKTWGFDLGSLTDPGGDYLFAGTLEEGGTLSFDSQGPVADKYKVKLVTQGANPGSHEIEFNNPGHFIYRTRGTPVGTSIGPGSSDLIDNVPTPWASADIAKYAYVGEQPLQRLRPTDADRYTDDIATRQTTYPNMKGVSLLRYDLAMFAGTAGDPTTPYFRPAEAWGAAGFPQPTAIMGATPRSGRIWYDGTPNDMVSHLAKVPNGSWSQNATNKSHTEIAGQTTITCPYRLYLDVATKTWSARENRMNVADPNWLDLYTDVVKVWRANSGMEGYLVGPVKIQWAYPLAPSSQELFQAWIHNTPVVNPGWNIASDSGGTRIPSWGPNRTFYDFDNNTVLEVLESSWEMVRLLRAKDPTSVIMYDPLPAHVSFGSSLQNHYKNQYISANPGTTSQDAKDNYASRLKEMADLSDTILFPEETDVPALIPNDYVTLTDRNEIRKLNQESKWIRYPDSTQTTIQ